MLFRSESPKVPIQQADTTSMSQGTVPRPALLESMMKIGQVNNKHSVSPTVERKSTSTGSAGGSAEPSAKVELSSAAKLGSGGTDAVFDAEKVKRIADAIRDGKYEINAGAIADKLIVNAQELLSPHSKA
jgi:negative regulator of flagellin synthesis FlgM